MSSPPWGITPQGFNLKTFPDIQSGIEASQLANISTRLNVRTGPLAINNGIISQELADLWMLGLAVSTIFDPDQATDDQLASLAEITGTKKRDATFSICVGCTVNVNPGDYPAGTLVASVAGAPSITFSNLTDVDNTGGGPANFIVDFEAQVSGPIAALAGTLTVKAISVPGWNSITNPTDAEEGLPIETDAQLRTRREEEVRNGGSASGDAIEADILNNLGQAEGGDVISVTVLTNDLDVADSDGLTPHSIECIVRGELEDTNADNALAAQILTSKGGGDGTNGARLVMVKDSQGNVHAIRFTRPALQTLYITAQIEKDPTTYAGDAAVLAALVAWGQGNLSEGTKVVIEQIRSQVMAVAGVKDIDSLTIGLLPTPVGIANIAIDKRSYADIDSSRITLTSVDYSP